MHPSQTLSATPVQLLESPTLRLVECILFSLSCDILLLQLNGHPAASVHARIARISQVSTAEKGMHGWLSLLQKVDCCIEHVVLLLERRGAATIISWGSCEATTLGRKMRRTNGRRVGQCALFWSSRKTVGSGIEQDATCAHSVRVRCEIWL